jgi:hypothetical protein
MRKKTQYNISLSKLINRFIQVIDCHKAAREGKCLMSMANSSRGAVYQDSKQPVTPNATIVRYKNSAYIAVTALHILPGHEIFVEYPIYRYH